MAAGAFPAPATLVLRLPDDVGFVRPAELTAASLQTFNIHVKTKSAKLR